MKSITPIVALSALVSQASAHYIFNTFSHGATKFPTQEYVRMNTNYNSPVIDLTSNDLRCNVGGEDGSSTATVSMAAGDSFTITPDTPVYHDGPFSLYMAKAPTTAASFDGSGIVWFKILDIGPTFSGGSSTWPLAASYTSTIPKNLPSGEYLLRTQQLAIHNPYPAGIPQFYISCTQVSITGGGNGVPGPLVSIPGFITGTEPGYTVNIYSNFNNYTVPGPAVWNGAAGSGSAPPPVTSAVKTTLTTVTKAPTTTSAQPMTTSSTKPLTTSSAKPLTTSTKVVSTTSKVSSAAPAGSSSPKYGQCGGIGWTGPTTCASGSTCVANGAYYSQCV